MRPVKVMGFDQRSVPCSRLKCDWSDYDGGELTIAQYQKVTDHQILKWLEGIDVVWGVETFYQDHFPKIAADNKTATVQHVNPEFYRWALESNLPRPTVEVAPSSWRLDQMSGVSTVLPTPVDRERCRYRQRPLQVGQLTFLHVVGMRAIEDRNGSEALWEALKYVKVPCRLLVRAQSGVSIQPHRHGCVDVEVIERDIPNYWSLYDDGDVLIMPRRYGGQALSVQEAMSCGLPVVMTDLEPQREWLPAECLTKTKGSKSLRTQAGMIDVHTPDPRSIAAVMDSLSSNPGRVQELSAAADQWAERRSWPNMRHRYEAVIADALEKFGKK
jgi:glycosyltransferase involved in cell wall biosynthesis